MDKEMQYFEEDYLEVYEILTGLQQPDMDTDWIENIFVEGTAFSGGYQQLWDARESLMKRLDVDIDDPDLEKIMDAVMTIEREVARHMFRCGMEWKQRMGIV